MIFPANVTKQFKLSTHAPYIYLKNIDYSILSRGSTQPLIAQIDVKDFDIYFDSEIVYDFEKEVNKFMSKYDENKKEISKL